MLIWIRRSQGWDHARIKPDWCLLNVENKSSSIRNHRRVFIPLEFTSIPVRLCPHLKEIWYVIWTTHIWEYSLFFESLLHRMLLCKIIKTMKSFYFFQPPIWNCQWIFVISNHYLSRSHRDSPKEKQMLREGKRKSGPQPNILLVLTRLPFSFMFSFTDYKPSDLKQFIK